MFGNDGLRKAFQGKARKQAYVTGRLLPVLTPAELLGATRHQEVLRAVEEIVDLPEEEFDRYYRPAIEAYAGFVQVLPAENRGALSGLLNIGLARATLSLQNFIADQQGVVDPVLNYAAFTAGLFTDVSKIVINQKIILTNEEGVYQDEWQVFSGSMVGRASYYRLYPISAIYQRLHTSIAPMLARQLLPVAGFHWIAQDLQVFADWLEALRGDYSEGGRLCLALSLVKPADLSLFISEFELMHLRMLDAPETEFGEAFLEWLKEGLENGEITFNSDDAMVHVVQDGVFIDERIFQQFEKIMNTPVNHKVVLAQFGNLLGIASKGGLDFVNAQYFSKGGASASIAGRGFNLRTPMGRQSTQRMGTMLADPALLFEQSQIPAKSSVLEDRGAPRVPASHQVPQRAAGLDPTLNPQRK